MKGRDIALATLHHERVPEPCINFCWMTNTLFMSRLAGRDYWSDPEGVFNTYLLTAGVNLVPQNYMPRESHRRLEQGEIMHDEQPGGAAGVASAEDVVAQIEALPDDETVEYDFNLEAVADAYVQPLFHRMQATHDGVLAIGGFGMPSFMAGYTRWGYEPYLTALAYYPDVMQRHFHHAALQARLKNTAIVHAREQLGIAPFVYSGDDICFNDGPMASPRLLRQLYFPELKWALEPLVEAGIRIIWHCDGNVMPVLDDILACGPRGLQGFQEEAGVPYEDMVKLRDPSGDPISVWGCVSVTTTLPHGTVDDVKAAVERSFRLAGPGRGFVLSSTSSIMPEVAQENLAAFFEHGRDFGRRFLAEHR